MIHLLYLNPCLVDPILLCPIGRRIIPAIASFSRITACWLPWIRKIHTRDFQYASAVAERMGQEAQRTQPGHHSQMAREILQHVSAGILHEFKFELTHV